MILILFSESYPYASGMEQTFLEDEIRILVKKFDRVILVPRGCQGFKFPLPDKAEVNESYTDYLATKRIPAFFKALVSPHFFLDLLERPSVLLNVRALTRLIRFVGNASLTRRWVLEWLAGEKVAPEECIFYTYWFDDAAFGLGLAKNETPSIRVISRAHGYDLYEERYKFPYWPRRKMAISLLDHLFPDSEAGLKYLQERYPEFAAKYEASLLGVKQPGFLSSPSNDGMLRIVSCSRIVPVKRVELIMEGIAQAARIRNDIHFLWVHFGEGETLEHMQAESFHKFPANAQAEFPGYESRQALYNFFSEKPVDVFVNVSESEGTSVAVMEAISCGIPIIATAVGGNVEIVSERNGLVLSANPSPDEVADALLVIYEGRDQNAKREESFRVWQDKYDAEKNFTNFADKLISINARRE